MRPLLRAYDRLLGALAVVAGVILSSIFLGVVIDVMMRNLGFQSPRATVPLAEYGLLYITMLAAPWLLRTRGQIVVESFRGAMPPAMRGVAEIFTYLVCGAVCAVLAWYALLQFIETLHTGQGEQRAILVPGYYAFGPLCLGFFLMFVEFLRLIFRRGTLYDQSATGREGF